jgi:UDP-N-acetylmuramate--alanine ligase
MGGSNARVGSSDYLVVESDESDGSFLKLAPIIAVVTNIDREHMDHYRDMDHVRASFAEFVSKVPFYGAAILCLDDENVQQVLPMVNRRTVTYGAGKQVDLRVTNAQPCESGSEFGLSREGEPLGRFRVRVPGFHNVLNATAAVAVAMELDVPLDRIREGLAHFSGVDRRFQIKGKERGVTVVDDYGHHPTEIRATLDAAREARYPRIHVLFQPHRFTRTQLLMDDFARSFHAADTVHLMDIYAASEPPIEGVTAQALAVRMEAFGHRSVRYVGSMEAGVASVVEAAQPDDLIITLGAGNVSQAGERILARLRGAA